MNRSSKEILLIALLACLWAIQLAVGVQQLLILFHPPSVNLQLLLPEAVGRMQPKWDLLIYISFIVFSLTIGNVILRFYHKPVNPWLVAAEALMTFLIVSALFKIMVCFNSPQLAQASLKVMIGIAVLSKIFYPEIKKLFKAAVEKIKGLRLAPYADAWWVVVIALMIYMPDLSRVIAMIYMGDWLHHFDYLVMSVGWASFFGQIPYADIASQYGVGLPLILANITHACGSFDYTTALGVMMWLVILYFILMYFFVKCWLNSALIAGVAFLLTFRLQMFHYGVSPLIWSVPSASPLRFGLDILWMAFLWQHLRSGQSRWLVLAAVYSGFAVYYMTSSGLCVMASFWAYLIALALVPDIRRTLVTAGSLKKLAYYASWILPVLSAIGFFGMTIKGHLFEASYWHHLLDYMEAFQLRGSLPMFESLKYRHYWAFFMSMALPLTYIATVLYVGVGLYLGRLKREWLLPALLAIYGLGNYQYYVVRSAITSYYVDALSFVLIACFWFEHALTYLPVIWQQRLRAAALVLSFYALLTNQNYLAYPNLMNFSRNPMTDNLVIQRFPDRMGYFNNMYKNAKEKDKLAVNDLGTNQEDVKSEDDFPNDTALVKYVQDRFDFSQDSAMISRLVPEGQRVALISSFETKILMQAKRPPFFYHFPLLTSRPMSFRVFPADAADTPSYVNDTLGELEDRRPAYVFMEKVFLREDLPGSYQVDNARLLVLIAYVRNHYQPVEEGRYLVAMKRKGGS